jgi:hypothetical protein
MPPSSDVSYSATVEKTGRPAEAARARVAASPATTDSRFPFSVASRESSRKLMRDVATRDPKGQHDGDPHRVGLTDAIGRGGDLVVAVEIEDPGVHQRRIRPSSREARA